MVTCTPRSSIGRARGADTFEATAASVAGSGVLDGELLEPTKLAPSPSAATAMRTTPTAALLLRRFLRLTEARRSRNRSFGSMGGNSIDTGAWTLPQRPCAVRKGS